MPKFLHFHTWQVHSIEHTVHRTREMGFSLEEWVCNTRCVFSGVKSEKKVCFNGCGDFKRIGMPFRGTFPVLLGVLFQVYFLRCTFLLFRGTFPLCHLGGRGSDIHFHAWLPVSNFK